MQFSACFKISYVTPVHNGLAIKRNQYLKNLTIDQLVHYLTLQRFLKGAYVDNIFSNFQHCFRKGHITQDCLMAILENCKKTLGQGKAYGALLMDLCKAFDYLPRY